ncbi:agamous-like MADS-box protein AGL62 [Aristolochia californica]|uniref:agamous-like MADS-box protein AGL62 n=1 Tax=Aristolochia californica TaxID=171875 RepID=UPI0035E0DFF6
MATKTSTGRKKILIQKIEKEDALHVCFSKRRNGIFKKASELSILCGVEIAIIVFSPSGKAYSFGHPTVDSVLDRFLGYQPTFRPRPSSRITKVPTDPAQRQMLLQELHHKHAQTMARVEEEKLKRKRLQEVAMKEKNTIFWWKTKIEEMNLQELEQHKADLARLREQVKDQRETFLFLHLPPLQPPPAIGVSGFDLNALGGINPSFNDATPLGPPYPGYGTGSCALNQPWMI